MGSPRLIWRGDVYDVDLGEPVGREPAFRRPCVVVSTDVTNNGPGELVVVVPITSRSYGLRSHIEVEPGASGLDRTSYARCDQIRTVSTRRLVARRGTLEPDVMHHIDQALRFILDL